MLEAIHGNSYVPALLGMMIWGLNSGPAHNQCAIEPTQQACIASL